MCLIFLKEKKQKPLTKDWCQEVWTRNNDGWGMTYIDPKKGDVEVLKGLVFDDFWRLFNDLQLKKIDVLVHMRMATQGLVNVANVHPFEIGDTGIFLVHNGVVNYPNEDDEEDSVWETAYAYGGRYKSYYSSYYTDESDTNLFVERFLKPLLTSMSNPSDFIRTDAFAWMMDEVGGRGNKFALTDSRGHVILNVDSWSRTTKEMLVSNTYAFTTDKKVTAPPVDRSGCVMYPPATGDTSKKVG